MSKKEISKSIRLSKEVYDYINAYKGNGFNEKFENIILDYQSREKVIKGRIESETKQLKSLVKDVDTVCSKIDKLERLKYSVDRCLDYVDSIETDLKEMCKNSVSQKKAAASGSKTGSLKE